MDKPTWNITSRNKNVEVRKWIGKPREGGIQDKREMAEITQYSFFTSF
jgi:hypothetical protein